MVTYGRSTLPGPSEDRLTGQRYSKLDFMMGRPLTSHLSGQRKIKSFVAVSLPVLGL